MANCKLCGNELLTDCEIKFGICEADIHKIGDLSSIASGLFGMR